MYDEHIEAVIITVGARNTAYEAGMRKRKRKLEAEAEEALNFSGSGSGSGSNNKEVLPLPIIGFTLYFFTLILAAINRRNFNRNL